MPPWLEHDPLADRVVFPQGLVALFYQGAVQHWEPSVDEPRGLAGGVHVDALNRLHGAGCQR